MNLPRSLLHGPDLTDALAAWAGERIEHIGAGGFGPCWAVGVVRNDAMAAVVVFHDFQPWHGTVQLSAAADQYFLENGVSTAARTGLVGSGNYVKSLNLVANETYPTNFTQGITITIAGVAGVRTITYAP
jgi:hypothetical protein